MDAEIKVSVIIVNYRTSRLVIDCIQSVREKTRGIGYEIIVVDNNSEPDLEEKLREECGEGIRCILLGENLGFGLANNAGFEVARGEYIFCLNPDTLLLNNAIKELADHLDHNPEAGACGGNLFDAEGKPTYSFYRYLPGLRWEIYELTALKLPKLFYGKNVIFNHSGRPIEVGYVTGADLMIRRKIWEKTGGFSEEFFMYYEETDLCARIKRLGYKIMSVPASRIIHLEGASFGSDGEVKQGRYDAIDKSRRIYFRRNLPRWKAKACDALYLATCRLYLCIFRRLGNPIYKVYEAKLRAHG